MRKLIKNGQVYDGKSDSLKNLDVLINGKYIEDTGKFDLSEEGIEIFDANNFLQFHVYLDIVQHSLLQIHNFGKLGVHHIEPEHSRS